MGAVYQDLPVLRFSWLKAEASLSAARWPAYSEIIYSVYDRETQER